MASNNLHSEESFIAYLNKHNTGLTFPTLSSYVGSFDSPRHVMHGCGVYTFPDGSTYSGQFVNGLFEGQGTITLTSPYNAIIRGVFLSGKLTKLRTIDFIDGLRLEGRIAGECLNFKKWSYCNNSDRRFLIEHIDDIQPVGPTARLTARNHTRGLKVTGYDVEEGIYDSLTGSITLREPPLAPTIYVGCPHSKRWIQKHCRAGQVDRLPKSYGTYILHTNKISEEPLYSHLGDCVCEFPFEKEFGRPICQKCDNSLEKSSSDEDIIMDLLDDIDKMKQNTTKDIRNPEQKSSMSTSDRYSILMTTSDLVTETDRQTSSESDLDPGIERMIQQCTTGNGPIYEDISRFEYDWTIFKRKLLNIRNNPLITNMTNLYRLNKSPGIYIKPKASMEQEDHDGQDEKEEQDEEP